MIPAITPFPLLPWFVRLIRFLRLLRLLRLSDVQGEERERVHKTAMNKYA